MKQQLQEIKFSLDNGFTTIERKNQGYKEMLYKGSFGVVVVSNEDAKVINTLLEQYTPITINGNTTLERYAEHSGLKIGDTVSTGKRTKKITGIKLMQYGDREPEISFYLDLPNGSYDIVSLKTAKKYKVVEVVKI